jgi:hypothetical protein
MKIDVVVDVKTTLGEGPLWDVEQERLYWIDSFDGRVFRATADGRELRAWDVPMKIGSMALRKDGNGAIVALARGFHLLDFKTGDVELIHDPEPDKSENRINDGKVDKQGRFVAGSMDTMESGPNGALYRVDPDLSVHKLDDGIIVSKVRVGVPTVVSSILQTPGRVKSGPITTIRQRETFPIAELSQNSTRQPAAPRMALRSMRKAACGTRKSMTERSSATGPMELWTVSSICL